MAEGLGGLLGNFAKLDDPNVLYGGLLSDEATQRAINWRGLMSAVGALGQAAMPSRLPVPLGGALGIAAGAMGPGEDAVIKARTEAAQGLLYGAQGQNALANIELMKTVNKNLGGGVPAERLPGQIAAPAAVGGGGAATGGAKATPGNAFDTGDPDLNLIAKYESSYNPNIGWSGVDLSGAKLRPDGFPIWEGRPGPAGNSSAAGLFQIQPGTWAPIAKKLGITDFSVESQIKVAKELKAQNGLNDWLPYNPALADAVKRKEVVQFPSATQTAAGGSAVPSAPPNPTLAPGAAPQGLLSVPNYTPGDRIRKLGGSPEEAAAADAAAVPPAAQAPTGRLPDILTLSGRGTQPADKIAQARRIAAGEDPVKVLGYDPSKPPPGAWKPGQQSAAESAVPPAALPPGEAGRALVAQAMQRPEGQQALASGVPVAGDQAAAEAPAPGGLVFGRGSLITPPGPAAVSPPAAGPTVPVPTAPDAPAAPLRDPTPGEAAAVNRQVGPQPPPADPLGGVNPAYVKWAQNMSLAFSLLHLDTPDNIKQAAGLGIVGPKTAIEEQEKFRYKTEPVHPGAGVSVAGQPPAWYAPDEPKQIFNPATQRMDWATPTKQPDGTTSWQFSGVPAAPSAQETSAGTTRGRYPTAGIPGEPIGPSGSLPGGIDPAQPIPSPLNANRPFQTVIPPVAMQAHTPDLDTYGKSQSEWIKESGELADAGVHGQQAEVNLNQIAQAYSMIETGTWTTEKAKFAGMLSAMGIKPPQSLGDLAAVQIALHANYRQTLQQLSSVNKRFTGNEFKVTSEAGEDPGMAPRASLELLSSDLAQVRQLQALAGDWNAAQTMVAHDGSRWVNPDSFKTAWTQKNPLQPLVNQVRSELSGQIKGTLPEGATPTGRTYQGKPVYNVPDGKGGFKQQVVQ